MAGYSQFPHREIFVYIVKYSLLTGVTLYALRWLISRIDPGNGEHRRDAKKKAEHKLEALGKNKLKLSEYEKVIASNLVIPSEIKVSWSDIAGLENIIDEINETVIFPIKKNKFLSNSKLNSPPKGVLLYGPPGCGKTLIAKATAKEAVAAFINLDVSMLTDKWYGESQKLVAALFSLAVKLQPCIIFIDEIDALLRARSSNDYEATALMKSQFMLLWDGLSTDSDSIVIVMGATNRPDDIDSAILRRMPSTFHITLPNSEQRISILKLILDQEKTENLDYDYLAEHTLDYSGAELKELCRIASLYRIKEFRKKLMSQPEDKNLEENEIRPITMKDMEQALNTQRRY